MAKTRKKKPVSSGALKALLLLLNVLIITLILLLLFKMVIVDDAFYGFGQVQTVRNMVVIDDSVERPDYDAETIDSASQYDVKMNSVWTFENGRSYSEDAYVENPVSNANDVYFDVTVAGYDKKILESPVIPVGGHIENISFDKVLSAGTYNGVLTFHLLGSDGKTNVGELQVALKIVVQK